MGVFASYKKVVFNPWIVAVIILVSSSLFENPKKSNNLDVVIVGAGFSGIAAAEELYKNGIKDFLVLEAKDYLGGRVKKVNFAGVNVPLGAGWLHEFNNKVDFRNLLKKHGIRYYVDNYDDVTYRKSSVAICLYKKVKNLRHAVTATEHHTYRYIPKRGFRRTNSTVSFPASQRGQNLKDGETGEIDNRNWEATVEVFNRICREPRDLNQIQKNGYSLTDILCQKGWRADNSLQRSVEYTQVDFDNSNSADLLPGTHSMFTGTQQDVLITDNRGYEHLLNVIVKPFQDKIKLKTSVATVTKDGEQFKITTSEGVVYRCKYLLVSVFKTVLEQKGIKFTPDLPRWKYEAFKHVISGHYCKIYLQFPYKFWDDSNYIILGRPNKKYVHWQNLDRAFSNFPVLMATLTGEECRLSQLETDRTVRKESHEALSQVYGKNIPWPIDMLRSNWTYDPFVRGAYINAAVRATDEHFQALASPLHDKRLWFIGGYTTKQTYSYVDGAYRRGRESGEEVSKLILETEGLKAML